MTRARLVRGLIVVRNIFWRANNMTSTKCARSAGSSRTAGVVAGDEDPLRRDYHVSETVLGSGADGGVVRGTFRATSEWHALKYLSRKGYDPSGAAEISILRGLSHPNIIALLRVYPPAVGRSQAVLATPEADCNLHEFLRRRSLVSEPSLPQSVKLDIVSQLLEGLSAVHHGGIVHRDLKPSNVLLTIRPEETTPSRIAGCEQIRLGGSAPS